MYKTGRPKETDKSNLENCWPRRLLGVVPSGRPSYILSNGQKIVSRLTMSQNVDSLVVKISQTLDASGQGGQRTVAVVNVRIELQVGRHLFGRTIKS